MQARRADLLQSEQYVEAPSERLDRLDLVVPHVAIVPPGEKHVIHPLSATCGRGHSDRADQRRPGAPNVDPLSPQDAAELISLLDQLPVDELEL